MPKLKTHKGAAKRFRTTATGKVKRGHSHARHILTKKTQKRKRNLDIDTLVSDSDMDRVKAMLPYGKVSRSRKQPKPSFVVAAAGEEGAA
jgi:large subunit ribosomal protein L35